MRNDFGKGKIDFFTYLNNLKITAIKNVVNNVNLVMSLIWRKIVSVICDVAS